MQDERVMQVRQLLTHEENWLDVFCIANAVSLCRDSIHACQEAGLEQIVWTDGACTNNQDHRFRRAGAGIYYNDSSIYNLSFALPGIVQTNQRAELFAVLVSCLRDPRPLDIRSYSEYVCNGFESLLSRGLHLGRDHDDLWKALESELDSRESCVRVSWVKAHANKRDIEQGRTTLLDMKGNNGADELAVAGASVHQFPSEVVTAAHERRDWAVNVQQMMVSILKARFAEENATANDAGDDRGSDMGDHVACQDYDHDDGMSAEASDDRERIDDEIDSGEAILSDTE